MGDWDRVGGEESEFAVVLGAARVFSEVAEFFSKCFLVRTVESVEGFAVSRTVKCVDFYLADPVRASACWLLSNSYVSGMTTTHFYQ